MPEIIPEKQRLREFLERRGIEISSKRPPTLRCPNPAHLDENPTAIIYENQEVPAVYCPICDPRPPWSVIDVCGMLDNLTDFKEMLNSVRLTLNITEPLPTQKKKEKRQPKKSSPKNFMPFPIEKKEEINREIEKIIARKDWGKRAASWRYHNSSGEVIALDIRFEGGEKKKEVITFWYDGKLKYYGTPVFIYNLQEVLACKKTIIITEGCKCADVAKELKDYVSCTWSGGSGKAHLADWSIFKDRKIIIWPDYDDPGLKAAKKIKKMLPQAEILDIGAYFDDSKRNSTSNKT
jgi:5S rRNA maturation endonuclease (ribonuclease M5)